MLSVVLAVFMALAVRNAAAENRTFFDDGQGIPVIQAQFSPKPNFGRTPAETDLEIEEEDGPSISVEEYAAKIRETGCGVVLLHFRDDSTLIVWRAKGDPKDSKNYVQASFRVFRREDRRSLIHALRHGDRSNPSNETYVPDPLAKDLSRYNAQIAATAHQCEHPSFRK